MTIMGIQSPFVLGQIPVGTGMTGGFSRPKPLTEDERKALERRMAAKELAKQKEEGFKAADYGGYKGPLSGPEYNKARDKWYEEATAKDWSALADGEDTAPLVGGQIVTGVPNYGAPNSDTPTGAPDTTPTTDAEPTGPLGLFEAAFGEEMEDTASLDGGEILGLPNNGYDVGDSTSLTAPRDGSVTTARESTPEEKYQSALDAFKQNFGELDSSLRADDVVGNFNKIEEGEFGDAADAYEAQLKARNAARKALAQLKQPTPAAATPAPATPAAAAAAAAARPATPDRPAAPATPARPATPAAQKTAQQVAQQKPMSRGIDKYGTPLPTMEELREQTTPSDDYYKQKRRYRTNRQG